jgi:hypothetical protein
MKFSELLGEPEPEHERDLERDLPDEAEPISVFAPVPVATPPSPPAVVYPSAPPEPVAPRPVADVPPPPPVPVLPIPPVPPMPPAAPEPPREPPTGLRAGLAEINVRQESAVPTDETPGADPLTYLETVDDDLLPSRSRR